MSHLRSIRTFVVAITLSAALFGVRATMPTVFADCGNQNNGGGCKETGTPALTPAPVDGAPWWTDLVNFLGSLLPSIGE
jgi:hypothetical protein